MRADDFEAGADPNMLKRREFAFTSFDDTYVRNISFSDAYGFRKRLLTDTRRETGDQVPAKVHIGAVYSSEPRLNASITKMTAVEKELVFDIDANDYDEVRFCPCKGSAKVCSICWTLMENAMRIVDTTLREDFGFEHMIWIFSGRRGVHCWVCDDKARKLGTEGRTAVASYLHVERMPPLSTVEASRRHPMLDRAYKDVLLPYWEQMVKKGGLLEREAAVAKLMSTIAEASGKNVESIKKDILDNWDGESGIPSSKIRWEWICASPVFARYIPVVIFHFAYPRLDIQVSVQWNHLLKAPMTVHPSTGMVCVPITSEPITSRTGFDPTAAPRIHEVMQEMDIVAEREGLDGEGCLRLTSLGPSIRALESFVAQLVKERRRLRSAKQSNHSF